MEADRDACRIVAIDPQIDLVQQSFGANVLPISGSSADVLGIADGYKIRRIFHFGGYARIASSFVEPETVFDNNVSSVLPLVRLWRETQCLFINAASSSVFSVPLSGADQGRALSPYTLSKDFMVQLLTNYASWYNLSYRNLYFYNVYGRNEVNSERATVVESLLARRKLGLSLQISKPGTQRRVFTHVSDAVCAASLAANESRDGDYHIGSDDTYSLLGLARLIGGPVEMTEPPISARDVASVVHPELRPNNWDIKYSVDRFVSEELNAKPSARV